MLPLQQPIVIDANDIIGVQVIGRGQFGEVVQGTYCGMPVVVKRPVSLSEEVDMHQAQTAIYNRWAALPPHPHILPVYGAYTDASTSALCVVSPLITDGSLESLMHRVNPAPWYDEAWVHLVLSQVAQALDHMHENWLLHLDGIIFWFLFLLVIVPVRILLVSI